MDIIIFPKLEQLEIWKYLQLNIMWCIMSSLITKPLPHYWCLSARPSSNPTQVSPKSQRSKWKLTCNTDIMATLSLSVGARSYLTHVWFGCFLLFVFHFLHPNCEGWRHSGDNSVDARPCAHQRNTRNVRHLACVARHHLLSRQWRTHAMTRFSSLKCES